MSYVTSILTQLPFGNIIGGPLKAAIEAQALAARATIEFIREVGFTPATETDSNSSTTLVSNSMFDTEDVGSSGSKRVKRESNFGEIRNVTFTYRTQTEQVATATAGTANANPEREVSLTVPLLTIVPIPYLRIDEMTIDFMVKVTEEVRNTQKRQDDTAFQAGANGGFKSWWHPVTVDFNTSLSTKHSSTGTSSSRYSTEATMNVHVRAVQDAMPAGLAKVLSILETAIKEKPKTTTTTTP